MSETNQQIIETIKARHRVAFRRGIALGWIIGIVVGSVTGAAVMDYHYRQSKPTPLQKVMAMHDHMQNDGVRYVWRQLYCGQPPVVLSSPIAPMDSIGGAK